MQAGEQSSQFIIILKVVDAYVLVLCGHYLPPDQITPDCWRFCNPSIGPRWPCLLAPQCVSHKGEDFFRTSPGPKASPLEVSGVVGATIECKIYKQTSLSLSQKQDIEKLPTQKWTKKIRFGVVNNLCLSIAEREDAPRCYFAVIWDRSNPIPPHTPVNLTVLNCSMWKRPDQTRWRWNALYFELSSSSFFFWGGGC